MKVAPLKKKIKKERHDKMLVWQRAQYELFAILVCARLFILV